MSLCPVVVADLLYPRGGGYKYIYVKIIHNICADHLANMRSFMTYTRFISFVSIPSQCNCTTLFYEFNMQMQGNG